MGGGRGQRTSRLCIKHPPGLVLELTLERLVHRQLLRGELGVAEQLSRHVVPLYRPQFTMRVSERRREVGKKRGKGGTDVCPLTDDCVLLCLEDERLPHARDGHNQTSRAQAAQMVVRSMFCASTEEERAGRTLPKQTSQRATRSLRATTSATSRSTCPCSSSESLQFHHPSKISVSATIQSWRRRG